MDKPVRISIRTIQAVGDEINNLKGLYEDKTGVEIKKSSIIELALKEGLNVLRERYNEMAEYKIK